MSEISEPAFVVVHANGQRRVKMSPLYNVWVSMRNRCANPKHHAWHRYGGRGVSVWPAWQEFSAFKEWADSAGYAKGLYLDRIDNDLGYSPQNCRWVTESESTLHKSTVRLTPDQVREIRGAQGTQAEIAERFGISRRHARDIRNGTRWGTV